MTPSKTTPLNSAHTALGATMSPFAGTLMPIRYGSILEEHHAVRTACGIFDTCHMGEIQVTGATAADALDALLTAPIVDLAPGRCRYALMLNNNGGTIDDLLVYRFSETDFLLVVNAGTRETDVAWIREHCPASVTVTDRSDDTGKLDIQGPDTPRLMQRLLPMDFTALGFYHLTTLTMDGIDLVVSRTGYTGEIGYELYCPADSVTGFWHRICELGARPIGLGARDTLRLEMAMPLYGHELSADRNAGQSGLIREASRGMSFPGSNAVFSPEAEATQLVGIAMQGRRAARHGDAVYDQEDRRVGIITSGSLGPSVGQAVALAYVSADCSEPNTPVAVRTARSTLSGSISNRPFYPAGTARDPVKKYL